MIENELYLSHHREIWLAQDALQPSHELVGMGAALLSIRLPDQGHPPTRSSRPMGTNKGVLPSHDVEVAGLKGQIEFVL